MVCGRVVVSLAIVIAACGGPPSAPVPPPTNTAPPAAAAPPAAVTPPPEVHEPAALDAPTHTPAASLARMAEFRDAMCACKERQCADEVTETMTRWGQAMAREAEQSARITEADAQNMATIVEAMTRCMTTAMTAGTSSPSAVGPADATADATTPSARVLADAASTPQNVPPNVLEALRISSTKLIVPADDDKRAFAKSKREKMVASVKLCVDTSGNVSGLQLLKSSGFARYDAKLLREMAAWRYSPFMAQGNAAPVCTAVTFIYTQSAPPPPAP
jgi:TonB family protein